MARRRKIRRGRHSFSRRRRFHIPWKGIGAVLVLVVLCGLGVLTAKWIGNGLQKKEPSPATDKATTTVSSAATVTTATAAPQTPQTPALSAVHGCYLPKASLQQKEAREQAVVAAKKAGFNAVVFDLKDTTGAVGYASATAGAKKAACVEKTALSLDDLKAFAAFCEKNGVVAIPRLCCFEDPLAAKKLDGAHILYNGDASLLWLDNSPQKGGKPWLNPYSPEAHAYMQGYVTELVGLGFKNVMLTGVQFPTQTFAASFGSTKFSSLSKLDVLTRFVTDTKTAAKKADQNATITVCVPALATFSDNTAVYGGNPLNFGADAVAPLIFLDSLGSKLTVGNEVLNDPQSDPKKAVELVLKQTSLRLKLIDEQKQPLLLPFVQGYDVADTAVQAELAALRAQNGDGAAFVMVHPDGKYPLAAY